MRACAWDSVVSRPFAAYFLGVACVAVASLIAVEVREGLPSSSYSSWLRSLSLSPPSSSPPSSRPSGDARRARPDDSCRRPSPAPGTRPSAPDSRPESGSQFDPGASLAEPAKLANGNPDPQTG